MKRIHMKTRRAARYLREFRWCIEAETGKAGVLDVARRLVVGAWCASSFTGRRVSPRVKRRRWRVCSRCPLLDTESRQCTGCGCYAPFKLSVRGACYAAERGGKGAYRGWPAADRG